MLDLHQFTCPRCGGDLEPIGEGSYRCLACDKTLISQSFTRYQNVLGALDEQRREDVNRLKRKMWSAAHQENVKNSDLQLVCEKILQLVDNDIYAEFYLATCQSNATDLTNFLSHIDMVEHAEDIPLFLNYLINALRPEWFLPVADFIDRAYMGTRERDYWRNQYDQAAPMIDSGVFDPRINRDVFVAYSSKDMPHVKELVDVLEDNGFTCFLASRNLQHGSGAADNYYRFIYEAMSHCKAFVFVSSSHSRNRQCDVYLYEMGCVEKYKLPLFRVEYLIEPYTGKAIERNFTDFFKNKDWCETPEKVVYRLMTLFRDGENAFSDAEREAQEQAKRAVREKEALQQQLERERALKEDAVKAAQKRSEAEQAELRRSVERELRQKLEREFAERSAAQEAGLQKQLEARLAREQSEKTALQKQLEERLKREQAEKQALQAQLDAYMARKRAEKNKEKAKSSATTEIEDNISALQAIAKSPLSATSGSPLPKNPSREARYKEAEALHDQCKFQKAAELYRLLAAEGDANAQCRLGLYYCWGMGVPKNTALAKHWYQKAANQGHALAKKNLENMKK